MLYRVLSVNSIFQDTFLLIPRKSKIFFYSENNKKTKGTKILISYLVFVFFFDLKVRSVALQSIFSCTFGIKI